MSIGSRLAAAGCMAYAASVCSGEVGEYVVTFADGRQHRVVACAACRDWFAREFRIEPAQRPPAWRSRLTARDESGAVRAA